MANVSTKKQDPGLLRLETVLADEFRAIYGESKPWPEHRPPPAPDTPADRPASDASELTPASDAVTAEPKVGSRADPPWPDEAALRAAFFDAGTSALCLSGGGIRSASFCLGVVQGLARLGVLSKYHYLSTVSGGGYLGCMMAAWGYRTPGGMDDVQTTLAKDREGSGTPIAWWREYLSYLAPRRGLLSLDTWTLMATYLRNLLLNALVWLPMIAIALLAPNLVAAFVDFVAAWLGATGYLDDVAAFAMGMGAIMLALGTVYLRSMAGRVNPDRAPRASRKLPRWLQQPAQAVDVMLTSGASVQALLLIGAVVLACSAWWLGIGKASTFWHALMTGDLAWLHLDEQHGRHILFALLYAVASGIAAQYYQPPVPIRERAYLATVLIGLGCGLFTGLLIGVIVTWFVPTGPWALPLPLAMTLGPPALAAAVGLGEILFVGLTSKWSDDFDREWWARAGAWAAMYMVAWLALFAMAFYGPELFRLLPRLQDGKWPYWLTVTLASGGVARIILVTGRSAPTETQQNPVPRKRDQALDLLAFALMFALVAGIADLVATVLDQIAAETSARGWQSPHETLPYAASDVLILLAFLGIVLGIAGSRININRFSLHAMYRDRLIRAFLGATRAARPKPTAWKLDKAYREDKQFEARKAEPFIQFDRDDNPIFRWLARERVAGRFDTRERPFLLVNAALNLVGGQNLAWQERKATSFTFSALHTGSAAPSDWAIGPARRMPPTWEA